MFVCFVPCCTYTTAFHVTNKTLETTYLYNYIIPNIPFKCSDTIHSGDLRLLHQNFENIKKKKKSKSDSSENSVGNDYRVRESDAVLHV